MTKLYEKSFRKTVREIYEEINKLEKTEVEEIKYSDIDEKYRPFALLAFALISLELFLKYVIFRSVI